MLTELLLVSLATVMSWEMLRYITPAEIPVRLSPFIITAISFGWTFSFHPSLIISLAATTGVAVFHKLTGAEGIEPWRIPDSFRRLPRRKPSRPGNLPPLPPSVGRRIPGL